MKIRPIAGTAKKAKTTDYGARVAVHVGEVGGAPQVTATLSLEDAFGIPDVLCHLKLSLQEARDLSNRLLLASYGTEVKP